MGEKEVLYQKVSEVIEYDEVCVSINDVEWLGKSHQCLQKGPTGDCTAEREELGNF